MQTAQIGSGRGPRRPRRSQAQRSAATRARLLEATIDCLVERGAPGTTTAEIEARAGASRGARLHHFPTKAALLSSAVEHLFRGLRESFEGEIRAAKGRPGVDRFRKAFALLWSNFADSRHAAVLELFMLARTDPDLRDRLREVTVRHHERMQAGVRALFPEAEGRVGRHVPAILESIHAAMEGLALRRVVFGDDVTEREALATVERMTGSLVQALDRGTRT